MPNLFIRRAFTVTSLACLVCLSAVERADAVAWRWPIYCFFTAGSADITDRCKLTIAEAVESWHREQEGRQPASDAGSELAPPRIDRVEVLGYASDQTDAAKNDSLSATRARAVAAEVLRLGIPKDLVTWMALADQHLMLPAEPADPQNQRVQIILY